MTGALQLEYGKMPVKMVLSKTGFCEEKLRLMEEFLAAATDLVTAHNEQVKATPLESHPVQLSR